MTMKEFKSVIGLVGFMVSSATFNNISDISWRRKLEYPDKTTGLSQVTGKLDHII